MFPAVLISRSMLSLSVSVLCCGRCCRCIYRRQQQQQQRTSQQQFDLWALLEDVSQLAEEVLHECSGREMANLAHGFAALGFDSLKAKKDQSS
jgi:hypothetical protein